jgi:putative oxidoreductase
MTFPSLLRFLPLALLLLRCMAAAIFIASGWSDLKSSAERAKSIGQSRAFTIFLGVAEVAGGLGIVFGVLAQLAAFGLILIGLGAIYKKITVWHIEFWGDKTYGWHYDLMLIIKNLVIIFSNGGPYVFMRV